mmetsp:Transcript_8020/g.8872  ORF Transcript_8020/g.8872 Transcript_8020/m.8872 type:complete len:263 (+) Transcript_8020:185-973(+)
MGSRPELTGSAALFYNSKEAAKYDSSSRMIGIQREITERAIELLRLPEEKAAYILDIGCGSGLSGKVLEEYGHFWVGCDVSRDMLTIANDRIQRSNKKREDTTMKDNDDDDDEDDYPSPGDLMHHDMGTGLPFRDATFDACISISALQWLCYSNAKNQIPKKTFDTLLFVPLPYIKERRTRRTPILSRNGRTSRADRRMRHARRIRGRYCRGLSQFGQSEKTLPGVELRPNDETPTKCERTRRIVGSPRGRNRKKEESPSDS